MKAIFEKVAYKLFKTMSGLTFLSLISLGIVGKDFIFNKIPNFLKLKKFTRGLFSSL
jgi:hypothetical protein